jgi:signal transduction histidine kinase
MILHRTDGRGESSRISSSGLGLAIAQQLIQAYGGRISVENQLTRGLPLP